MTDSDRSLTCTPSSTQPSPRPDAWRSISTSASTGTPVTRAPHDSGRSGDTWPVRMTASRLVGRVAELAELELAWREVQDRQPVLVLLGGESGVGKTRLVTEFSRRLARE